MFNDDDTSNSQTAPSPLSHSPDEDIYFENLWLDQHSENLSSTYVLEPHNIDITNPFPYHNSGNGSFGTGVADVDEHLANRDGSDWETVNGAEETGEEETGEEVGEEWEGEDSNANGSCVYPGEPIQRTYHPLLNGESFK